MIGIMRNQSTLKYVAAVILFGSNGLVASHVAMSSYDIVFTRTLIGALFLATVFVSSGQAPTYRRDKLHFALLLASGVAMGTSWLFLFEAYTLVGVSVATLAYYCGPVIVMLLAPLVFRERLALSSVVAFATVVAGMLLVNGEALLQGQVAPGLVFGVLAAFAYSAMVILNKKVASINGLENAMWQLVSAFVIVALFVGIKRGFAVDVPAGSWLPVLILGLVNTGVGCYLYFSSIGGMPAQGVAVLGYLEPLSALLFAAAFLGESLAALQLVGSALILGGTVCSELMRQRLVTDESVKTIRILVGPAGDP